MSLRCFAFVLAAFVLSPLSSARADARQTSPLQRARVALVAYDLAGDGTVSVLRELGAFASGAAPDAERREARFLRAVGATDLVVLAALRHEPALRARVAAALGVDPDGLEPTLLDELAVFRSGFYGESAAESAAALRFVAGDGIGAFQGIAGVRRDAITVLATRDAVAASADPLAALAALANDPCPSGTGCAPGLGAFDPTGRRAITVLRSLGEAFRRLDRARRDRDAFTVAMSDAIDDALRTVRGLGLRPAFAPSDALPLAPMAAGASEAAPDVLVTVAAGEVRWSFLPSITLDDAWNLQITALGEPVYPASRAVRLPTTLPSNFAAIDEITAALRPVVAVGGRVALGAAADVEAQVASRVLLSVRAASGQVVALAGVVPGGSVRFLALAPPGPRGEAVARIFVRLGGYDLDAPGGRAEIPRLRDAGGFRFDVDGLERALAHRTFPSASVRTMGGVSWGAVIAAASRLVTREPVELLLPR